MESHAVLQGRLVEAVEAVFMFIMDFVGGSAADCAKAGTKVVLKKDGVGWRAFVHEKLPKQPAMS
jgi:hypothetical protein